MMTSDRLASNQFSARSPGARRRALSGRSITLTVSPTLAAPGRERNMRLGAKRALTPSNLRSAPTSCNACGKKCSISPKPATKMGRGLENNLSGVEPICSIRPHLHHTPDAVRNIHQRFFLDRG